MRGTHRLQWRPQITRADQRADYLRSLAMGIEEAVQKDGNGVSLDRAQAHTVTRALWDFADRLELN